MPQWPIIHTWAMSGAAAKPTFDVEDSHDLTPPHRLLSTCRYSPTTVYTAVPSLQSTTAINEDLRRARTKVEALSKEALTMMAPLLRQQQKLVAFEQSGDSEAHRVLRMAPERGLDMQGARRRPSLRQARL